MTDKVRTDWEMVEREYRAGTLSIREIAKNHGISDGAIRKKAKLSGWERDLSEKVNEKVRTELVRTEVRTQSAQTEREIIEIAAATVVQVVRGHRVQIRQGQALVELLTKQLIDVAGKREDFEAEIEVMTADDKGQERYNRLMKAISLEKHSTIAGNLAVASKTWIGLERQAFSIKDESEPLKNGLTELFEQINGTSLPVAK